MIAKPLCFIMMPFKPEFNYFFLYLKHHIESNHPLRVERGDTKRLTKPLIQKITEQIREARLAIADISGSNPNILYEVGLAHAQGKPVIFLTQDPPEQAPVDLRQFEFISYDLSEHKGFLDQIDIALRNELSDQFEGLFDEACRFLEMFKNQTGHSVETASEEEFHQRVSRGFRTQGMPSKYEEIELAEFLLPKIIHDSTDIRIMKRVTEWLSSQFE